MGRPPCRGHLKLTVVVRVRFGDFERGLVDRLVQLDQGPVLARAVVPRGLQDLGGRGLLRGRVVQVHDPTGDTDVGVRAAAVHAVGGGQHDVLGVQRAAAPHRQPDHEGEFTLLDQFYACLRRTVEPRAQGMLIARCPPV